MKRFLMLFVVLLLLPCVALAAEPFELTATVTAEESALKALPIEGAEAVLPLSNGDALTVTALGTSYCEAVVGDQAGYIATADIAFDILAGEPTRMGVVNKSPDSWDQGRLTVRQTASRKGKALCKVAPGCLMLMLEEEGEMLHVVLPEGEGYILSKYVVDVKPARSYRIAYVDPGVKAWLRLDSQYPKKYLIFTLSPGTPVQFISNPNGWAEVEVAGYRGRMLAHNLTFTAPED